MKRIAAAVLIFATAASAQIPEPKKKVAQKTIIFGEGTEIDGDLAGPNLETILVPQGKRFESLIKVRENFSDKLMQSVNEL